MTRILLIGNPNCGKTTLFNALTGSNQKVGNWPGVTVEKKTGSLVLDQQTIDLTDLPGIYSLSTDVQGLSQDEQITTQSVVDMQLDAIINVVDACTLERHLYLTSQLLELGKPLIVVLNMMDIAEQRGITIDIEALEKQLGCTVIPVQAHKKIGMQLLFDALRKPLKITSPLVLSLSSSAQEALKAIEHQLIHQGYSATLAYYYAYRIAEGDLSAFSLDRHALPEQGLDLDILLADARYNKIHTVVGLVQKKRSDASNHSTALIDKIVLHRFFALPIFFTLMYLMFLFAINIGGAFQDFFDISTNTIFVQGSAWLLEFCHAPNWLIALIAHGVGTGINTTLTFIPVIAALFFFLSFLESSGYMARAAFVVDKAMRLLGLPGKSFVPMIVGFGCNVPAIMAARTLDSERDRLLTIMMSPFMSCSARLAIYAVFVAAFFPSGGQNIVFSLYMIGILMAVLTGFILRKTQFKGHAAPLILELPAYHRPSLERLCRETLLRLKFFVLRAGKLIVPICVLLGGLNAITIGGGINAGEASSQSVLSLIGQWITPLFEPMGIHQNNWPATVGLLTGMLAKEVVVGTLNSLYTQVGHFSEAAAHFDFFAGMKIALWSIPHNLSQLGSALWNPVLASAADQEVSLSVYGVMNQRFDGKTGAYAYLLFVLLYIPCVSTMAVIRQEASKQLMWTSIIWSFLVAYASAVIFYQLAHFMEHPQQSILWVVGLLLSLFAMIGMLHYTTSNTRRHYVASNT